MGVQRDKPRQDRPFIGVSIPILRVGVQLQVLLGRALCRRFQFPYCAWEFNHPRVEVEIVDVEFQFPYCAWEFNPKERLSWSIVSVFQFPYCAWEFNAAERRKNMKAVSFNSHTARGSSTFICCSFLVWILFQFPYCAWEFNLLPQCPAARGRGFQFPYCAWEFNIERALETIQDDVSIPILRVGVQRYTAFSLPSGPEFQFPYCAWEFNPRKLGRLVCFSCFNSHTARGSSTAGVRICGTYRLVSIPILRVGVQHHIRLPICRLHRVSIPILRVGVQPCM